MKVKTILATFVLLALDGYSQADQNTLFSIKYSVTLFNEAFNNANLQLTSNNVSYTISSQPGFNLGFLIEHNFNERYAFRTGIQLNKYNYKHTFDHENIINSYTYGILNYEIPITGLIYAKLNESMSLTSGFGFGLNLFPTNQRVKNQVTHIYNERTAIALPSLNACIGFKYKTENFGQFYTGMSYTLPFVKIANIDTEYYLTAQTTSFTNKLRGNYFGIDFIYFFQNKLAKS